MSLRFCSDFSMECDGKSVCFVSHSLQKFEFCASIEYDGNEYVVLLPTDDDDGEVVILQVMEDEESDDEDEVTYVSVDDDDVLQKVFDIFKEQAGDEFDFDE